MTVTDDHQVQLVASPKHQKSIFIVRMSGICILNSLIVEEDALRFCKRDAMLALIGSILGLIPLKSQHNYSIIIS